MRLITSVISLALSLQSLAFITVPGLPETATIRSIVRDKDGYTWLAADNSVFRFDGHHTVRFSFSPTVPMRVNSLLAIEGGKILAGTSSGLYSFQHGKDVVFSTQIGEALTNGVNSLSLLDSTTVAIAAAGGIFILNHRDNKISTIPDFKGHPITPANAVTFKNDTLYASSPHGLWAAPPPYNEAIPVYQTDRDPHIIRLFPAQGNRILAGTNNAGLLIIDVNNGKILEAPDLGAPSVTGFSLSDDNSVLVATDGNGVFSISPDGLSVKSILSTKDSGLPSNQVYSSFVDSDGTLWTGFYQKGAALITQESRYFNVLDIPGIFDSRNTPIRALHVDEHGIMLGTRTGLYHITPDRKSLRHVKTPEISSDMILSIAGDGKTHYIGTYGGGALLYDSKTGGISRFHSPVLDSGTVFAIETAKDGYVWFATAAGLVRLSKSFHADKYTPENSALPSETTYCVKIDSKGRLWAGTSKGPTLWDSADHRSPLPLPEGLPSNADIRYVHESPNGNILALDASGTLFSIDGNVKSATMYDNSKIDGASISAITEDNAGNLWLPSDKGLIKLDSDGNPSIYGLQDGLPTGYFTACIPFKDSMGGIWLGSPKGLISFTPGKIPLPHASMPLEITSVFNGMEPLLPSDFRKTGDISWEVNLTSPSPALTFELSDFSPIESPSPFWEYNDGSGWKKPYENMTFTVFSVDRGTSRITIRDAVTHKALAHISVHIPYPYPLWIVMAILAALGLTTLPLIRKRVKTRKISNPNPSGQNHSTDPATQADNADAADRDDRTIPERKYISNSLSHDECAGIRAKLEETMSSQKPFLNKNLSISQLAELAGTSSFKMSQFLSQELQTNFYDYINEYRAEEFKKLAQSPDAGQFTLTALSEQAGFSSRATFFRFFKKREGITPAEFLKSMSRK